MHTYKWEAIMVAAKNTPTIVFKNYLAMAFDLARLP